VRNRVRVVRANHSEPGRLGREVARVVAALLPVVPAPPVDLNDNAALNEQVNATDTGDRHLTLASQTSRNECDPNHRLDSRLGARVEHRQRHTVPGRNTLKHALEFGQRHESSVQRAVKHGHGEWSRLASGDVRQRVEQSCPCRLTPVERWPPMPHNLAARSRSGSVEEHMHSRVGWAPQSEGIGRRDAGEAAAGTDCPLHGLG
jgi:hypothetical protein